MNIRNKYCSFNHLCEIFQVTGDCSDVHFAPLPADLTLVGNCTILGLLGGVGGIAADYQEQQCEHQQNDPHVLPTQQNRRDHCRANPGNQQGGERSAGAVGVLL